MRRRPFPRALAARLATVALCAAASADAGSPASLPQTAARSATPAAPRSLGVTEQSWLSHARRVDRDGWVHLRIAGGPRERGFQHGFLLAKEIDASLRTTRRRWQYRTGMDWPWLVRRSTALFQGRIDAELLAELDGLVAGLGAAGVRTSRAEMVAYNAITELAGYWWPEVKGKLGSRAPEEPKVACSSFIATGSWTRGGGVVLGHNTMTSYTTADCNLVLEIVPRRGHRILMQGSPGWIHSGTDFFVTDAGLVGSETTISGFSGFDEKGIPEFVRMRRATQDASSIDAWCAVMRRGNNGGYANAWLLGDVNTGEIARLELGLKHVGFERTKDGYFTGSNLAENLKILRLETDADETDIRNSDVARRVRWKQLMRENRGKIDLALAQAFEGDHVDSYLGEERIGARSLCAHWERETSDPAEAPYNPSGTVDAKAVDAALAKRMAFVARWGSGCGTPFDADAFLERHPQFEWMQGLLPSRGAHPWTEFRAGELP
jgi:hypothetical protein